MSHRSSMICMVLGLALIHPVFARLGETEAQCDDRYGVPKASPVDKTSPILDGGKTKTYRYQGWTIRVAFLDDVAVREIYQRIPTAGVSPSIKDFEVSAMLEGEKGNSAWKTKIAPSLQKLFINSKDWIRGDGATASLTLNNMIVRLELPVALEAEARAKEKRLKNQKAAVPKF